MPAPDTLPADFFQTQQRPPDTLPADFFQKSRGDSQGRSWLDSARNYLSNAWGELAQQGAGMVQAVQHPIDALKGIGESQDAVRLKAEKAFKNGDYAEGVRHVLDYLIPVMGPAIDARGDQAQRGDVSGALGGATTLGLEMASGGVSPETVGAAADATGTALNGAARTAGNTARAVGSGVKAAAPDLVKGGAQIAAGELLSKVPGMEWPARFALDYPGARQMASGIRKGITAAQDTLGARVAAALQDVKTPEAFPDLAARQPRWAGMPEPQPSELPDVQPIPATATPSGRTPGPRVQPAFSVGGGGDALSPLQPEKSATAETAPTVESPRSQFTATGERKSPQLRGEEIKNANRQAKAQRIAQALVARGVEPGDLGNIPMGHFAQSQIDAGASPGWGNIAQELGEKEPSSETVGMIYDAMQKLKQASSPLAKNPKALEIAQKLRDEMQRSGTIPGRKVQ